MKFTYGDSTKVKENAPKKFRPGEYVAICGITIIDNDYLSLKYNFKKGTITYTIEFDDGSDILIPEDLLEETDET